MDEQSRFQYCTWCFADIPLEATVCPDCGPNLDDDARHTPRPDRLMHALHLLQTHCKAALQDDQGVSGPNTSA